MEVRLNNEEIETLLSALATAASRREAQARAARNARHHDEAARKMRELHFRLLKQKETAA